MSDKIKNITVSVVVSLLLVGFLVWGLIAPDLLTSTSERRKLQQAPAVTLESIENGTFMSDFDTYTLDQFPLRDTFRMLKAFVQFDLFHRKDNNDIYVVGDSVFKLEYPLSESSVQNAANKFNTLYEKYLQNMNVYYSIVPDKNYFAAAENGYPALDYDKLVEIMNDNVQNMTYIDIFGTLEIGDYYHTDTHWSQEKILDTVRVIAQAMGIADSLTLDIVGYTEKTIDNFYGVYYGQAALPMSSDTIHYLTNDIIDGCTAYNYETDKTSAVYNLDKLTAMDLYDVFLSGATPLIEVTNPAATTDKELIVFRDSFGSSLSPLLLEAYSKVTLVDIRYINSDLLGNFIDFENQDVLFLYSTLVLNSSSMLK